MKLTSVSAVCVFVASAAAHDVPLADASEANAVYSGPGVIALAPQFCHMFHGDDGASFLINELQGFFHGDRVFIEGTVVPESTMCFPFIADALEDITLLPYFDGCGILHFGPQNCMLLAADSGESLALGNIGPFFIGDRVAVTGIVNVESQLCFPFITPGIDDNTIEACGPWGDINGDGVVDVSDLLALLGGWGPCPVPPGGCPADLNFDGIVDVADLLIVLADWS